MTEPARENADDQHLDHDDANDGEVSEGGSAFGDAETAVGGADAVPDTPDINPGTPEAMQGE